MLKIFQELLLLFGTSKITLSSLSSKNFEIIFPASSRPFLLSVLKPDPYLIYPFN